MTEEVTVDNSANDGGQNVGQVLDADTSQTEVSETVDDQPDSSGIAAGDVNAGGGEGDEAAQPVFEANTKFKVLDEEHEFDDFLKSAIKDQDQEKRVRELYEKAYGIETIKEDRQTLRDQLSEEKTKLENITNGLDKLSTFVEKNDFDSFFDTLNIPKQQILKYALELVQRENWTPEQKAAWEQQRNTAAQAAQYEQQNQELIERNKQLLVEQRNAELTNYISKPEISAVANAYNENLGNDQGFQNFVIGIGQSYAQKGEDISVERAVSEAILHIKAINPSIGRVEGATASPEPKAKVVEPNSAPVIPNVQGRGTSPVRSTIKSLDDIKKRYSELSQQ